jgi:hypothetical protein
LAAARARPGRRQGLALAAGALTALCAGCDAEYVVGALGLAAPVAVRVGSGPLAVALADLDGDGAVDAAVLDATPQVCTLRGHNDGTLTPAACVPVAAPAAALGLAALAAAGRTSLLVAGQKLDVYTADSELMPALAATYPLAGTAAALQTAAVAPCDRGSDPCRCRPAVLVGDGAASEIALFYANQACDGSLAGPQHYPVGAPPVAVTAADLDGDGAAELVSASRAAPPLTVLGPRGVATFTRCTAGRAAPASAQPSAVAALDLDRDGSRVLVVADQATATLRLLRASRSGPLTLDCGDGADAQVAVAADPVALATADLDGDGAEDLVVAHGTPAGLSVLLGTPGALASPRVFPLGSALTGVAVGDLNQDGRPDVVAASRGDATVVVLRGAYR